MIVNTVNASNSTTTTASATTVIDLEIKQLPQYQHQVLPLSMDHSGNISSLISPSQSMHTVAALDQSQHVPVSGRVPYTYQPHQPQQQYTYIYPVSPPFSFQSYSGYPLTYQNYPGWLASLASSVPAYGVSCMTRPGLEQETQHHSHNMYVRGLAPSMTDEMLLEMCGTMAPSSLPKLL